MINKSELKKGWYKGKGRNSNIAYWTGSTFLTIGKKFGHYVIKDEGLWEEGLCFKPEEKIENTKIETVFPLKEDEKLND